MFFVGTSPGIAAKTTSFLSDDKITSSSMLPLTAFSDEISSSIFDSFSIVAQLSLCKTLPESISS